MRGEGVRSFASVKNWIRQYSKDIAFRCLILCALLRQLPGCPDRALRYWVRSRGVLSQVYSWQEVAGIDENRSGYPLVN